MMCMVHFYYHMGCVFDYVRLADVPSTNPESFTARPEAPSIVWAHPKRKHRLATLCYLCAFQSAFLSVRTNAV